MPKPHLVNEAISNQEPHFSIMKICRDTKKKRGPFEAYAKRKPSFEVKGKEKSQQRNMKSWNGNVGLLSVFGSALQYSKTEA